MEVEKTIRVLLTAAEDKALHELAHQLRTYSNVRICNCVTDGMILRQAIKELKPDAILMEVLHAPCQNDALLSAYQQTSHRPPILFYGQRSTPLWMHKAAAYGTCLLYTSRCV